MARPLNPRKFQTEETKSKISRAIKLKHQDPIFRERFLKSCPQKGTLSKQLLEYVKQRNQNGENNPNWKGGKTDKVTKIRKCRKYKSWVKSILTRDKFTCQECGSTGGDLNAHHIIPFSKIIDENNEELLWNQDNGQTLCVSCHKLTESYSRGDKYSVQTL